jgi:hypothetical protein
MAEQLIESVPWESEEAESPEADEAFAEAEDSGEAHRRSRRPKSAYQPARGVQGMTLRGSDGSRSLQFPAKLATAAEMNRGLANQELARRGLDERLDRLELKFRGQQKKDVATTGAVSLAIAGGLSLLGAFQAAKGGFTLNGWANEEMTQMAAVVSATQLATTAAKSAVNSRYIPTTLGITADAFSVLQLAVFAFGYYQGQAATAGETQIWTGSTSLGAGPAPSGFPTTYTPGTQIFDPSTSKLWVVISTNNGLYLVPAANPA